MEKLTLFITGGLLDEKEMDKFIKSLEYDTDEYCIFNGTREQFIEKLNNNNE